MVSAVAGHLPHWLKRSLSIVGMPRGESYVSQSLVAQVPPLLTPSKLFGYLADILIG
jgi:hypothetical protein